jgi:hypothetical protein
MAQADDQDEAASITRVPIMPLLAAAIGISGVAFFGWLATAIAPCGNADLSFAVKGCGGLGMLVPASLLPAAVLGAAVAHIIQRWWPFFLGAALTLMPTTVVGTVLWTS